MTRIFVRILPATLALAIAALGFSAMAQETQNSAPAESSTTEKMKQGAENAWDATKSGTTKAYDATKKGVTKAGNAVSNAGSAAAKATRNTGNSIGKKIPRTKQYNEAAKKNPTPPPQPPQSQ